MATESVTTTATANESDLLSREELRDRLLTVGESRYHHRHPFHLRMHNGELSRGQIQAWALNRFYYQSRIPIKDSLLLAKSDDPAFRRAWRKRSLDHDGDQDRASRASRSYPALEFYPVSATLSTPTLRSSEIVPC